MVPLFYSNYEAKFIKHMKTDYDCVAYETVFWQCSAKNYMNEVLFQGNFANNTTYS